MSVTIPTFKLLAAVIQKLLFFYRKVNTVFQLCHFELHVNRPYQMLGIFLLRYFHYTFPGSASNSTCFVSNPVQIASMLILLIKFNYKVQRLGSLQQHSTEFFQERSIHLVDKLYNFLTIFFSSFTQYSVAHLCLTTHEVLSVAVIPQ